MNTGDNITNDRTEGTSDSSGNPSVNVFPDFSIPIANIKALGLSDAESPRVPYILNKVSYQHLKPYLYVSAKSQAKHGGSVKYAHDLLTMDRRIQAALFKYIGIFEAQMRSQYAQWMNYVSGEFAIYNPELFHRVDKYERSFANYKKELLRKLRNKEESNVSIFQGIEVMTLGTLSQLYSNTKSRIVGDEVAKSFGATKSELTSWCKTITSVRNKIAHFEPYFVLREIPTKPLSVKGIELFNGSVFYICVLLAHLLSDNCGVRDLNIAYDFRLWNDMQDLIRNIYSYDKAALLDLGIPENWNDILINASNDSILHALKMQ